MIEDIHCADWGDYTLALRREVFGEGQVLKRGRFLFRGQGNSDWNLCSSFDRAFYERPDEQRAALEEALKLNFRRICESDPTVREHVDTTDERQLLCYAQHYGLPTRLLDWTESPFVAAFFAFESRFQKAAAGADLSDRVAIWILDRTHSIWTPRKGVDVFTRPTWNHDRLRNQQGWFSLSNTPFHTLEDYVEFAAKEGEALRKITIPGSVAADALGELDLMNINYATLFGDTQSMAKEAVSRTLASAAE